MTDPPTEEARAVAYAVPSYDDQYCPEGFGEGTGAAVTLDDYGFGFDYRWSRPTSRPPLRKDRGPFASSSVSVRSGEHSGGCAARCAGDCIHGASA